MKSDNQPKMIKIFCIVCVIFYCILIYSVSNASSLSDGINLSSDNIKQAAANSNEDKPYSEDYIKWLNSSDEEKKEYGDVIPEPEFIAIHNNVSEDSEEESDTEEPDVSLESSYRTSNITVESQNGAGWCWAFSSLKTLQLYLKKQKKQDYNLAEYHLAYMRYKYFGGWENDPTKEDLKNLNVDNRGKAAYLLGGDFYMFEKYVGLKNGNTLGPISGSNDENKWYHFDENNQKNFKNKKKVAKVTKTINFSYITKKYDNNGYVKKYYNGGNNELLKSDIDGFRKAIKEHIKNYGAVYTCTNIMDDYYNDKMQALYINNENIIQNHAVTIVGWDDNYSKNNFKKGKQPEKNGAWIALNTWGSSWGNNGYFYISYDDAIVEKNMCGVREADLYNAAPEVTVSYDKTEYTKNPVTVTIKSNQNLKVPTGWNASYNKVQVEKFATIFTKETVLTKKYTDNTSSSGEKITIEDESGASKTVTIKITNIDNTKPTITEVSGDKGLSGKGWVNPSEKGKAYIVIKASDNTGGSGLESGYYYSSDNKNWTRNSSNMNYYINKKETVYFKVKDKMGNESAVKKVDITNVDFNAPTISSVTKTISTNKQSVTLTINASDAVSGIASYSFDGGKTWVNNKQKEYTSNQNIPAKTIKVKDKAGNIASYNKTININGIDTTVNRVIQEEHSPDNNTKTKGNVKVTITVNKNSICQSTGWIVSSGGKILTKTFTENTSSSGETLKIKDANTGEVISRNIKVLNIDKSAPKIVGEIQRKLSNDNKRVTITIPQIQDVGVAGLREDKLSYSYDNGTNWTVKNTYIYTSNGNKNVKIRDSIGNVLTKSISINEIDDVAPVIKSVTGYAEGQVVNENVTITINATDNKELHSNPYSFNGGKTWQSNNTAIFEETTKGIIIAVRDKAGNIVKYNNGKSIDINIDKGNGKIINTIEYSTKSYTENSVTVTINLDKEIDAIGGEWTLSADGKTLKKVFKDNTREKITIKQKDSNNKENVYIYIDNIVIYGDINNNKKIDLTDLIMMKRHLISNNNNSWKLTGKKLEVADFNRDGKVNITDLILVKRKILKK